MKYGLATSDEGDDAVIDLFQVRLGDRSNRTRTMADFVRAQIRLSRFELLPRGILHQIFQRRLGLTRILVDTARRMGIAVKGNLVEAVQATIDYEVLRGELHAIQVKMQKQKELIYNNI